TSNSLANRSPCEQEIESTCRWRRLCQPRHHEVGRAFGRLGERIPFDNPLPCVCSSNHYRYRKAELLPECTLQLALQPLDGGARAENDVAAQNIGLDFAPAEFAADAPKLLHRHAVVPANVDSA